MRFKSFDEELPNFWHHIILKLKDWPINGNPPYYVVTLDSRDPKSRECTFTESAGEEYQTFKSDEADGWMYAYELDEIENMISIDDVERSLSESVVWSIIVDNSLSSDEKSDKIMQYFSETIRSVKQGPVITSGPTSTGNVDDEQVDLLPDPAVIGIIFQ